MSLLLSITPPIVALAGNDILFKIRTDNHQHAVQDYWNRDIKFLIGATTVTLDDFTLSWGVESHTFTFRTTPNNNDSQSLPVIAAITDNYLKILMGKIQANYYINRDFNLTFQIFDGSHSGFTFTPKKRSPETYLQASSLPTYMTIANSSMMWTYSMYATETTNFKINSVIEIDDEIVGEDSLPAIPRIPVDINRFSDAIFNVSEYLIPELTTEFLFPENANENPILIIPRPDICKKYEAKFYEFYGTIPIPYILSTPPETYALSGGISKEMEAKFNAEGTNFWEKLQADMMFLTWAGKIKTTRFNNTEKLFYLNFSHTENIYLMAYIKYTDDSYETTELFKLADAIRYLVYEIICSPAIIKINEIDPNKIVKSYTIYLENTARETISELRQYNLDYNYYENPREFLFFNSFEVPDTFWSNGEVQKEVGILASELTKKLPDFFIDRDFELEQERGTESQFFKTSFRKNSISEVEFMREFFLSSKRCEIITDKLYPISLISSKVSLYKNNEYLYSVDTEYKRAYEDKYFSDLHNQPYDEHNDFATMDFYLQDFSQQ